MFNSNEWKLFEELLIENGEPFHLVHVNEKLCNAYRKGSNKKLQIYWDKEKCAFMYGILDRNNYKVANYNPNNKDDLIGCIEEIIVSVDKLLGNDYMIHSGDVFRARTNAELLNILLGKQYKGYMKCAYDLCPDFCLIMNTFDEVTSAGWLNREQDAETVIEQFVGDMKIYSSHEGLPPRKHRALFEKRRSEGVFIFKGIYELDRDNSTPDRRVWKKTSDVSDLRHY